MNCHINQFDENTENILHLERCIIFEGEERNVLMILEVKCDNCIYCCAGLEIIDNFICESAGKLKSDFLKLYKMRLKIEKEKIQVENSFPNTTQEGSSRAQKQNNISK